MAVPYIFANVPGGTSIPLAELDANFAYLAVGPTLTSLTVSGPATFNGTTSINGPLSVDGVTINPTGITGQGDLVLNISPTLITPNIGTPSAGILTNCTGLPISTGVSGLGAGVASFLASPSSFNLSSAVTDETGTGSLVFNTNPTLVTPTFIGPVLGTPASGNLISCTGYPATSLTGILPITLGGTGANNQSTALNNLLPPQSAPQAGYVLTTNGAGSVTWSFNAPSGTVSSVALDPASTGLTVNGGTAPVTITTAGTFTLGGILSVSNGGTGLSALGTGVSSGLSNTVNAANGFITYASYAPAAGKSLTLNNTVTLNAVDNQTYTLPPATSSLGYLNVPGNDQPNGYVTVLTDSGKFIGYLAGNSTVTISANASVPYEIGTVITFANITGANCFIACGDTMYLAGNVTATGTRTIANTGLATAIKVAPTAWLISGSGLT